MDTAELAAGLDQRLAADDAARQRDYPGDARDRQPVHTVYVPADRVVPGIARDWGRQALAMLEDFGQDKALLAELAGVDPDVIGDVAARVRRKLAMEPVEDLRADLEDGFVPGAGDWDA